MKEKLGGVFNTWTDWMFDDATVAILIENIIPVGKKVVKNYGSKRSSVDLAIFSYK